MHVNLTHETCATAVIDEAIAYANILNCKAVHVMVGFAASADARDLREEPHICLHPSSAKRRNPSNRAVE